MSSFVLKIIACATMLLDHIGYSMQYYGLGDRALAMLFRTIGRVAFPIFAYLIVKGFKKTHNIVLYTLRVIIAGLISEVPYDLCFHKSVRYDTSQNVMFTFAIALIMLVFVDMCVKATRKEVRFFCIFPIAGAYYIADNLFVDYSGYGILLVALLYFADGENLKDRLRTVPVILLFAARYILEDAVRGYGISAWHKTQLCSALALVPILLYSGKKGYAPKGKVGKKVQQYAFYLFYPVHIFALYLIFSNFAQIKAFFGF